MIPNKNPSLAEMMSRATESVRNDKFIDTAENLEKALAAVREAKDKGLYSVMFGMRESQPRGVESQGLAQALKRQGFAVIIRDGSYPYSNVRLEILWDKKSLRLKKLKDLIFSYQFWLVIILVLGLVFYKLCAW